MDAVRTKTATFTKWMVGEGPLMAGVVGGAAGEGAYAGKVLDYAPGPTTVIAATYRFDGSDRPFTALVHVEQTGLDAELSGVVIDGWQKGRLLRGADHEIKCDHDGVTTDCWPGTAAGGRGGAPRSRLAPWRGRQSSSTIVTVPCQQSVVTPS